VGALTAEPKISPAAPTTTRPLGFYSTVFGPLVVLVVIKKNYMPAIKRPFYCFQGRPSYHFRDLWGCLNTKVKISYFK
jgi:hypothetical protein